MTLLLVAGNVTYPKMRLCVTDQKEESKTKQKNIQEVELSSLPPFCVVGMACLFIIFTILVVG